MIKSFFKKIFALFKGETKRFSIPQAFLILFLAVFFLFIAAYFYPEYFTFHYNNVDITHLKQYFDVYARNGLFKVPYFLFVSLFVALLGQIILVNFFKRTYPLGSRTNAGLLFVGLLVAVGTYQIMPYYLPDLSKIDMSGYKVNTDIVATSGTNDITETRADFCGKQIDFFFAPYEGYSIRAFQLVKELEKEASIPVRYQCVAELLNEDKLCSLNHGIAHKEESNKLLKEWLPDRGRPVFVLGCKYAYRGLYTVEAYKKAICEKLGEECGD